MYLCCVIRLRWISQGIMSIDHHSFKIASDCSALQKFPSYTFKIGIFFKMQRIERVKMAINQFPSHPLIHHVTTPTAKDVINSSTIHFGNYKKTAIRHFPRHTKSSSTSLIHSSIHQSIHHPCHPSLHPKSSSTSLILIQLYLGGRDKQYDGGHDR